MKSKLAKLLDVKSIVTLAMTGAMVAMLLSGTQPQREILMLFSSSYGAIITYFFTRKEKEDPIIIKEELKNESNLPKTHANP